MASSLDAAAAEAEATLAPAVERHVKLAKKQLDKHAGDYNSWLQQQEQQQQRRRQQGRSRQLLLSGSSSDG
jgi:ATPase subunit of ABC transporter with duplicated ATPase domains